MITVLLVAPAASAQVYRVAINSNASRTDYVDVYEYDFVDVQPQFPGGDRGLINYINKTRVYPYDAYQHKIQGRVICSFIVNTDGSICNISVQRPLPVDRQGSQANHSGNAQLEGRKDQQRNGARSLYSSYSLPTLGN